ncbi:alpha/beta fold hydrolase [Flavihumibacter sp. ZG627]|uniref:alpha/beta fold hydrolase n=1 Tax=Flavihumibacter sp. ZG627 TaxID=1463156 RepID=UPI000694C3DC|nr:alpha/beta fold hydrolase [Flavihumibacter sp. ZG627]
MKQTLLLFFLSISIISTIRAQSKPEKIAALVKYYSDEGLFNGSVLVAQKDEVIYKGAVGMANFEWNVPNTTNTRFRLGSITKQFTAMLIMQLVEEGKVRLDGKITDYLPNYRRETGEKVTIHHLLSHGSGIPNYTDDDSFFPNSGKYYRVHDFIKTYCSGDLEFEPGSRFNYSNSGYFILGAIIEAVSGNSYEKQLQVKVLDVVGMKNTGYDMHEYLIEARASGYEQKLEGYRNAAFLNMALPYSAGSLYSTVEDLHLWNQALYSNKLLGDSLKQKMFMGYLPMGGSMKSGYGWFIEKIPTQDSSKFINMIWHSGGINGFLTELARFPEEHNFIVVLDNTTGATTPLFRDIIAVLYDLPLESKKKTFANAVRKQIRASSVIAACDSFMALTETQRNEYDMAVAEYLLNRWGYERLREQKDAGGALKLFELNTKLFPHSSNVFDSYGEALGRIGKYEAAAENYKKSLEIDSSHKRRIQGIIDAFTYRPDTLRVKIDGHVMVLYKTGNKGPVVVLEAGGNSDHSCWSSIVPELSKVAIVITYDRPGYRDSEACSQSRTANRVAEELHQALNKSGISGPYIVGGWSWGGAFARAFAALYPAETKGLLLVDPATKESYAQMALKYPDEFTRLVITRSAINIAAQDEFDAMMPAMNQASRSDKLYKGKTELLIAGSLREWSASETPLKKIWISELQKWSKQQPNVRAQVVESGHFIQREKPEIVIAALKRLMGQ